MSWQTLDTIPIFAGCTVPPARAAAIRAALQKRIVPLLVARQCRLEPLATGALCTDAGRTFLLTCRHALDEGVALDDLAVPLADSRVLWLRQGRARVFVHPQRDLALIELRGAVARSLADHYHAAPLAAEGIDRDAELSACDADVQHSGSLLPHSPRTSGTPGENRARIAVLAGFPYAQMRRLDGVLYARPLVAFVSFQSDSSTAQAMAPATGPTLDGARSINRAQECSIDHTDRQEGVVTAERNGTRNETRIEMRKGARNSLAPVDVYLSYPRTAMRADGVEINAPELDGVSGATLWTVHDENADGIGCVLRATGVQVAFKPGAYVRAEPLSALRDLLQHVRA